MKTARTGNLFGLDHSPNTNETIIIVATILLGAWFIYHFFKLIRHGWDKM